MKVTFAELPVDALDSQNDDGNVRDEKKEDESLKEPHNEQNRGPPPRRLLTRDASVNNYHGTGVEVEDLTHERSPHEFKRPVLIRNASVNFYHGEGIEVADWETSTQHKEKEVSHEAESRMESLMTVDDRDDEDEGIDVRCLSFDETMSFERTYRSFMKPSIHRSLSDSHLAERCDSEAWLGTSTSDSDDDYFDTWKVLDSMEGCESDVMYAHDYLILGTSAHDIDAQPHVLSPPLMDSLHEHLPFSKRGENFWLKYSLVRDGASMMTLLQHARGAKYSLLAIETTDGDVFGAFTAEPWRKNWNTFGGNESFLWRMRHSRKIKCHSIIDQAHKESEIDVYPYTYENDTIQICTNTRIAVGGGSLKHGSNECLSSEIRDEVKEHQWGFGISLTSDLLEGTSSPCLTFGSPSLSTMHADGSIFEVINVELWTFTPCRTVNDAERLEFGNLFFETHRS